MIVILLMQLHHPILWYNKESRKEDYMIILEYAEHRNLRKVYYNRSFYSLGKFFNNH